jgi:protein TonB
MSIPSVSIRCADPSMSVRWPRVGALSTSFSLHGVAAAVFLMAVSAPPVRFEPARTPTPDLVVTVVESPPPAAPPPPVARTSAPPTAIASPAAPAIPARVPTRPAPTLPAAAPPSALAAPAAVSPVPKAITDTMSASVDYASVSRPAYPAAALRRSAQGEALIRVHVGADGRPGQVQLARSSGDRDLDRAAVLAVRGWRFQPARDSGAPVAAWVVVPVAFSLDAR